MKIETNLSDTCKVHDPITYLPIERQVMDFFRPRFPDVTHKLDGRGDLILKLDGTRCSVEIKKKTVKVAIIPPSKYDSDGPGIRFGEDDYPSVSLPFNKDVEAKIAKFCVIIRKIQNLERRALDLPKVADQKVIERCLNMKLGTPKVEVSFWEEHLFSGCEIVFYLHPKHRAPGDGVLFCLERGSNKITPFWNASTERRKLVCGTDGTMEESIGKVIGAGGSDLSSLKARVAAIEEFKERLDAFDPLKIPELKHLLGVKAQADKLIEEFRGITK